MTAESLVILRMFIENCTLEDFEQMFEYGFELCPPNTIYMNMEFNKAKTDFDSWIKKYSYKQIDMFVEFAEKFQK